ncbi:MAG: hypothetical protein IJ121_08260 [Eubacterium sp.]|nr:hypothetical protein [Eubacterium sp.]
MCAYGCLGPVVRGISLPSLVIVWARAVISAAALLLFLLLFRREGLKDCRAFLGPMVFSWIFLAVDWIGLFASYRYTTIATTTLCYYIAPVLVLLGAAIFLREKLSEMKGVLLALLGAFGYAVVILINKRYPEGDQLKRTLIQLCTAALMMTVYVLWTTDLSAYRPSAKDIGLLLLRWSGLHPRANYMFSVETEGNPLLDLFYGWIPVPFLYLIPCTGILGVYMLLITIPFELTGNRKNTRAAS